jgi:transcriptional regulator with XRE-family HTH domain
MNECDIKQAITELIKMRGWTQMGLSEELGQSKHAVAQTLSSKHDLTIGKALKYLDALGAELIVRDRMGSKKEWRIDDLLLRESVDE